ncbi:MAG: hypothetical protein IT439_06380 [Phycisphaerales bacterium]|nr:hypothetical protein [Phycisphaerales bacterium]
MGEVHEWIGGVPAGSTEPEWTPALAPVAGVVLGALASGHAHQVVWVGRCCWPCPLLLNRQPAVLGASVLVDAPDEPSRVWAMDVLLRSSSRLVVIGDGRGFSLEHTRRLQLAAAAGGGMGLLLRTLGERGELSAAATRWVVASCPGESERPRWSVVAIRNKHRPGLESRAVVEWDDASGLVPVPAAVAGGTNREAAAS